jgi:hypothetical protein
MLDADGHVVVPAVVMVDDVPTMYVAVVMTSI